MNVVIDKIVAVLKVLTFGNTVGSEDDIKLIAVVGHRQMLVLGTRRKQGQQGRKVIKFVQIRLVVTAGQPGGI